MLTPKQAAQAAEIVIRYHGCEVEIKEEEKQARAHQAKATKLIGQRETMFEQLVALLLGWDTEFADSQTIESAIRKANGPVNPYVRKAIDRAITYVVSVKEERRKKAEEPKNPRTEVVRKPRKKQKVKDEAMEVEAVRQTEGTESAAQEVARRIREKFAEVFEIIESNSDLTDLDKATQIWTDMVVERKVHLRGGGRRGTK